MAGNLNAFLSCSRSTGNRNVQVLFPLFDEVIMQRQGNCLLVQDQSFPGQLLLLFIQLHNSLVFSIWWLDCPLLPCSSINLITTCGIRNQLSPFVSLSLLINTLYLSSFTVILSYLICTTRITIIILQYYTSMATSQQQQQQQQQ